jgi:hypothetical protein
VRGALCLSCRTPYTLTLPSPSRERVVSGQRNLAADHLENAVRIFEDVVVPEADDAIAEGFDHMRARSIDISRMLSSVELDREAQASAGEVGDMRANGKLADEFRAFEPAASQIVPKSVLGIGALSAQFSRNGRQMLFRQARTPSSQPSPRGGEGAIRRRGTKVQGSSFVNA